MRQFFSLLVAVSLCEGVFAGVRKVPPTPSDPRLSAGLFVGVRTFEEDEQLTDVTYAVDDAVDLAYELSIAHQPPIPPSRVILALSGRPQKEASKQRLRELLEAGAVEQQATQTRIVKLIDKQAALVGHGGGILFVSFATHGVSQDGIQYLFTRDSLLSPLAGITDATVYERISQHADRAFIVIDACRERLAHDNRPGVPDPRSKAAYLAALNDVHGQVILSAATAGNYAYDDDKRMNGVFTATLIDALRCGGANSNEEGLITADAVASYVEEHVLDWLRKNKNRDLNKATQKRFEGRTGDMPLTICNVTGRAASSASPPR